MPDDAERLRRQLRAMAAMNYQLRAQLDDQRALASEAASRLADLREIDPLEDPAAKPLPSGAGPRRARAAAAWIGDLTAVPMGSSVLTTTADTPPAAAGSAITLDAFLAERDDGILYVVEGGRRRRVRSGLITPALESVLGDRRPTSDDVFATWSEGPPIEVLEGPSGPPFVIIAGHRLPVLRLPLPHPVAGDLVDSLPAGPPLDTSLRPVPPPPPPPPPPKPDRQMQLAIEANGGLAPAAKMFARLGASRIKKRLH